MTVPRSGGESSLKKYVSKELSVLIEEIIQIDANYAEESADCSEGLAIGRAWFQAPEVDGSVVVRYDLVWLHIHGDGV